MPDRPNRPSKPVANSGRDTAEFEAVYFAAKKALKRGDGWQIEQSLNDRLRADLEAIGFASDALTVTLALRAAFDEFTAAALQPVGESYDGIEGVELYCSRWKSAHFKRVMYLKFAMIDGELELFRLHEHREKQK